MRNTIASILFATILVAIGLAGGWYAARQGGEGAGATEHEGETGAPALSPQALKNLGVTVREARLSDFVRSSMVQAVVVDRPLNTQPLVAPLGGFVTGVDVRPGRTVRPGDRIATVAREPIPRPELVLTADILSPVSENLHEAVAKLRTAESQRTIASAELERVQAFTRAETEDGLPILPRKTEIDLRYDLARAAQESANCRRELERHGLSAEEVDAVAAGELPPGNRRLWKRALEINGLWGEAEEALLQALPERARGLPWSVAAIGELAAAGLATEGLAAALRKHADLAGHFVEIAALLLSGESVERVGLLADIGALQPLMELKAPAGAEDWDVAEVLVRPGQKVEAGDSLALLHDPRSMWLRLEPVGEEIRHTLGALESHRDLVAAPLLPGSGPVLDGLSIDRMDTRGGLEERGAVAFVVCGNEPVPGAGSRSRSWKLRHGLRYLVRVPVEVLEQRFVLPAGAVTERGPERIAFLQDGSTYRPVPVHVEYEDDEVVVVANDGSIFPGDPVVTGGAFALGLALQLESAAADPHAGHSHG